MVCDEETRWGDEPGRTFTIIAANRSSDFASWGIVALEPEIVTIGNNIRRSRVAVTVVTRTAGNSLRQTRSRFGRRVRLTPNNRDDNGRAYS